MSLLYLCAFLSIIVLWRPTANNARYGLEELPENAEQAYDLEMTPGFEADGQDIKRRTAASPDSESGHLHSPTGRAPQSATSPRQPPLKTGEVVFELSDNESPDDLIGGGGIMSNETRLSEVDLSGTNNRSAEEERRRKMDEISKLQ
jgi:hypothetical protein